MRITISWGVLLSFVMTACGVNSAERNNAGNWYVEQDNYDAAVIAFQAAQVVEPDNPIPYFNIAQAYSETSQIEDAASSLEQAILRGDDMMKAQAYYNLGNMYFEAALFEEAIEAYKETLILRPDDSHARYNLELAQSLLILATPTADEMQTEPNEGQVDTSATPTDLPIGDSGPTPTPPPLMAPPGATPEYEEGFDGTEIAPTPGPARPSERSDPAMTIEDAQRILDPIVQDQKKLDDFTETTATPGLPPPGKNW